MPDQFDDVDDDGDDELLGRQSNKEHYQQHNNSMESAQDGRLPDQFDDVDDDTVDDELLDRQSKEKHHQQHNNKESAQNGRLPDKLDDVDHDNVDDKVLGGQRNEKHYQQHFNKENYLDQDNSIPKQDDSRKKQVARKSITIAASAGCGRSRHIQNNAHERASSASSLASGSATQLFSSSISSAAARQPQQQSSILDARGTSSVAQELHRQVLKNETLKQREMEEQERTFRKRKRASGEGKDDADMGEGSDGESSDGSDEFIFRNLVTARKSPAIQSMSRRCRAKPVRYEEEHHMAVDSDDAIDEERKENITQDGVDQNGNSLREMTVVDFLTKEQINPETGLPMMNITCHSDDSAGKSFLLMTCLCLNCGSKKTLSLCDRDFV